MTRYQRKALSDMIGWGVMAVMSFVGLTVIDDRIMGAIFAVGTLFCLWRMGRHQRIFVGSESP